MFLISPADVKEGRSSAVVLASSWTFKKRKFTASQILCVWLHTLKSLTPETDSLTGTSQGLFSSGVTLHVPSSSERHSFRAIFTWTFTGLLHCSCVESRFKDAISGFGKEHKHNQYRKPNTVLLGQATGRFS